MTRVVRVAAAMSVAVLLLVLGAALRPLVVPDEHVSEPLLDRTEIGFVQDMAAHHQQALMMVQSLQPDADPAVLAVARQVGDAQRVEIGTLLGWLRLAEAPPTNPTPMAWMAMPQDHGHGAGAVAAGGMPGMASADEMTALAAARGRDADILFLQLLQRHHLGGVRMAHAADELIESGPVRELARGMMQQQSQEAALLTGMLGQRGAQPLT